MTKKTYDAARVRMGKVYLHQTFAGPQIQSRIVEVDNREKGIFMGIPTDEAYIDALREASVPYPKKVILSECKGVVYAFQIIREIRGPNKKRKDDKTKRSKRRIVRPSKNT